MEACSFFVKKGEKVAITAMAQKLLGAHSMLRLGGEPYLKHMILVENTK